MGAQGLARKADEGELRALLKQAEREQAEVARVNEEKKREAQRRAGSLTEQLKVNPRHTRALSRMRTLTNTAPSPSLRGRPLPSAWVCTCLPSRAFARAFKFGRGDSRAA